jgi:hypothetical protein
MTTMMKFYGYELELFAGEVFGEVDGVSVRAGTDFCGGHWLIVRVGDDPEHLVWICAPVSERTLHEVARGKAAVRDVLRHSVTGRVEVVAVEHGRAVPDRCLLCADIPAELLPPGGIRIGAAA